MQSIDCTVDAFSSYLCVCIHFQVLTGLSAQTDSMEDGSKAKAALDAISRIFEDSIKQKPLF